MFIDTTKPVSNLLFNGKEIPVNDGQLPENVATTDYVDEKVTQIADSIPTTTSQLSNDGDGVSKFATEQYVEDIMASGGSQLPENIVTTDTDQSITGTKTFDKLSFSDALIVESPNNSSEKIAIGKNLTTNTSGVIIGINNSTGSAGNDSVLIGRNCSAGGMNSVGIGRITSTSSYGVSVGYNTNGGYQSVAIGYQAKATNTNIQLGQGTNSKYKTLQVFGYELLDENGDIPSGRLGNVYSIINSSIYEVLHTEV